MIIAKLFLYFIIYCFIGWFYESTLCSVVEKKPVNRGFLVGPYCPVYGFGAMACLFALYGKIDNVFALFVAGAILTCTIEYITAVLLEKIFNAKWWDYSDMKFNIKGRVSLLGALAFGSLIVLLIKIIHPFVFKMVDKLSDMQLLIIASSIFLIFVIDLSFTVIHLIKLNGRLKEIEVILHNVVDKYSKKADELKKTVKERFNESEYFSDKIKKLNRFTRYQNIRLARAFPKLRMKKHDDVWQKIKENLLNKNK